MNYIVVIMPRRIDENMLCLVVLSYLSYLVCLCGGGIIGSTATAESDGFTTMVANKDV